jgi:hypothetical protein
MKRISIFTIAILMLASGISNAISRHVPYRFRTRYSPYAFSQGNPSGLICGELEYSPYAFSHKHSSGLIPYYVRYSPYAFGQGNPSGLIPYYYRYSPYAFSPGNPSGLISDYCSSYFTPYAYYTPFPGGINCCPNTCIHESADRSNNTRYYYGQSSAAQREITTRTTEYTKKMNMLREKDGMQIIYNYLKSSNINNFEMDRLFKVENKTVSVNFVFRNKNIIIKYWNPDEVQNLMQQSGYKKIYCEQYQKQWKDICKKHEETGGKVYHIESADKEEILNKLSLCLETIEG